MLFGRRFRVLVSVSAAFPVSPTDGEVVYNYRASIDTANFLGQFFRTISQVLNLGSSNNGAQSSELPRQVSFTNNEELNNSSSSTNPDGATPRKSDAGRTRKKKRKRKSTTKVMSKVMAVRQQQQKLTFSGFETNSSDKDSSSNTNTSTSTSGTASTSGGACASTTTTRWEMSAETLLTMTRTFLRYVPEQVVNHPRNRGIISRLCDLTGPEAVTTFRTQTIQWSCLMALQLLHLSPVKLRQNVSSTKSDRAVRIRRDGPSSSASTSSSSSPSKTSSSQKKKSKRKTKKRGQRSSATTSTTTNAAGFSAKKKLF